MRYDIEKVIDGIIKYVNDELITGMNDWQAMAVRIIMSRAVNNQELIKKMITDNGIIRAVGIVDSSGTVDVCGLAHDLKNELTMRGKITFDVPLIGKITFYPEDVNKLHTHITGREMSEHENN